MKTRLTQTESLILVSLFAFNPLLLQFLDQILSDIPYLFFSTLSLWLITKEGKRSVKQNILIGVSIFLVTFLRATGILLLVCFLMVEFFNLINHRRDWGTVRQIILDSSIVCGPFILLWITSSILFPGGGDSYLSQYAGLSVDKIRNSIAAYFNVYSMFFGEAAGWRYLYYVLVVFFLIGAGTRWKEELFFLLFFGLWMIVHVAYPYWQGPRYIFPLLPIFFYFTFQGMKYVLSSLPERNARAGQRIFHGFWAVLIAYFFVSSTLYAVDNLQHDRAMNGPFDPYSMQVYNYIDEKTPADSVVVFFKPRVMKLMTDHESIMSMDCEHVLKGDVLVLSRKVGPNQQIPPEEIGACNLLLDEVLRNNRFIVYQIQ